MSTVNGHSTSPENLPPYLIQRPMRERLDDSIYASTVTCALGSIAMAGAETLLPELDIIDTKSMLLLFAMSAGVGIAKFGDKYRTAPNQQ